MLTGKRGALVIIVIQSILIILLTITAITLRIERVGAQAGADHYRKALVALHDDHEALLRRIILQEREDLKREYLTTLAVAVKYGVVPEEEAVSRIRLIENQGK